MLKNMCLLDIEKLLQQNGCSLADFSMPFPTVSEGFGFQNKLIADELNYDREEMTRRHGELHKNLNEDQKKAYDRIRDSVISGRGGCYFVNGYGGTGKTYLHSAETIGLRSLGYIVLNTVSSRIDALLLPGGKTTHSTFSIPLVPRDNSTCSIS